MTDLKAVEPTTESMVAGCKTSPCPAPAEDPALCEHADAIRGIRKQTVDGIIEIGRRLVEAKKIVGHGAWLPWLEREFGWSDRTARNFINVHEMVRERKLETVSNLKIPLKSLYLLAAPGTSDEVCQQMLDRAANGETVSAAEIKAAKDANGGAPSVQRIKMRPPEPSVTEPIAAPVPTEDVGISAAAPKAELSREAAKIEAVSALMKVLEPFLPAVRWELCDRAITSLEGNPKATA
jgi:hypothetical protein